MGTKPSKRKKGIIIIKKDYDKGGQTWQETQWDSSEGLTGIL